MIIDNHFTYHGNSCYRRSCQQVRIWCLNHRIPHFPISLLPFANSFNLDWLVAIMQGEKNSTQDLLLPASKKDLPETQIHDGLHTSAGYHPSAGIASAQSASAKSSTAHVKFAGPTAYAGTSRESVGLSAEPSIGITSGLPEIAYGPSTGITSPQSGIASGPSAASAGISAGISTPAGSKKDPSQIVDQNVKYERKDVGKLGRALAHVYFGESVLRESTPCGKGNLPALDKEKLRSLVTNIHHHPSFSSMNIKDFQELVKKKIYPSIAHLCKELRNRHEARKPGDTILY